MIRYIQRFQVAGQLHPVAFIEHAMFDETPLLANLTFHNERYVEKARVFVLEKGWTLLVRQREDDQTPDQYLAIMGSTSPLLRAAENCKGEGILPLLRMTTHIPHAAAFQFHVRLSECDSAGANLRAEAMLSSESDTRKSAIFACAAHKVHKAAERTWQLPPFARLISGLIHAGLLLSAAQSMKLLREGLFAEVSARPLRIFKVGSPTLEEDMHRQRVLTLFSPSKGPRRRALLQTLATVLLNGNWRAHELQHYCTPECACTGEEDVREAIKFAIGKLLKVLRPGVFQRGDWINWTHNLKGFGVLEALHGLLSPAFLQKFGAVPGMQVGGVGEPVLGGDVAGRHVDDLPFMQAAHGDANYIVAGLDPGLAQAEEQKKLRIKTQVSSIEFFQSPDWHDRLLMLFQALLPQVRLMKSILHTTSVEWEHEQQRSVRQEGRRDWRVLLLHNKVHINAMLQEQLITFLDPALAPLPDDEGNRSEWLQVCMRPAAAVYQLLGTRVSGFPYKLFSLLGDRSQENAETIVQTPPCMLDDFSAHILHQYPTAAALSSSPDLFHILGCCASRVAGTTFSTERIHSGNARRSRAAAHTHRKGIEQLALSSASVSAPSWLMPQEGWPQEAEIFNV